MRATQRQSGFTLIELMFTLAVATIIIGIITRVVFVQQRSFMDQLAFAETQQNARASISLMKLYVRKAGWGMHGDANAVGEVPLGACYDDSNTAIQRLDCDAIDFDAEDKVSFPNGSDRLRVVAMNPHVDTTLPANGGGFVETPMNSPVGTIQAGIKVDPDTSNNINIATYNALGQPLASPKLGVISGSCMGGGGDVGSDIVAIQSSLANGAVHFEYAYLNLYGTGTALSCASGYASGFTFGEAVVADFWIDRTDKDHPTLVMRTDPRLDLTTAWPVAYDIDDLQVQYLLDTVCEPSTHPDCTPDTNPDHVWDEVCDNLTPGYSHSDGGCDPNKKAELNSLTLRQRLARVVGARIAIVARTREYDPKLDYYDDLKTSIPTAPGAKLTVQNHTYAGKNDGYRRWIYRATVALRNNEL